MIFALHLRKLAAFAVLFSLCVLMLAGASALAERRTTETTPPRLPFAPSEELVYEGEFTKALIRSVDIADLRFTATIEPGMTNTGSQENGGLGNLHLTVDAVSKGLLRKLFGLRFRQRIESTVDPVSFAVLQTTKLDEQGNRRRTSEAVFNHATGKVVWTERDPNDPTREPRVVSSEFGSAAAVQDLASVFYFLRTQTLTLGQSFEITVSDSGRIYRVPVHVVERKKMKSVLGEAYALRVEPDVFGDGRLVRGNGKMSIWFTEDARHIPVRAHITNEMGTLDIKLKSISSGKKA